MFNMQHHLAIRQCGRHLLIPSRRVWNEELKNVYGHNHNGDDVDLEDDPAAVPCFFHACMYVCMDVCI